MRILDQITSLLQKTKNSKLGTSWYLLLRQYKLKTKSFIKKVATQKIDEKICRWQYIPVNNSAKISSNFDIFAIGH